MGSNFFGGHEGTEKANNARFSAVSNALCRFNNPQKLGVSAILSGFSEFEELTPSNPKFFQLPKTPQPFC